MLEELALAREGTVGEAQGDMGRGLGVHERGDGGVSGREGVGGLAGERGDGDGLPGMLVELGEERGERRGVVPALGAEVVAHGLEEIVGAPGLSLGSPLAIGAGPPAAVAVGGDGLETGEALGGPAVNPEGVAGYGHGERHAGQGGEGGGSSALGGDASGGASEHVRDTGGGGGQVRDRELEQDLGVAGLAREREQLLEGDVAGAQEHGLARGLGEVAGGAVGGRAVEERVQLVGDAREATRAAGHQRVEQLEHARVVADHAQRAAQGARVGGAQRGEPLDQLAHVAVGERADGDRRHQAREAVVVGRRHRVARRDQEAAAPRRAQEAPEVARQIGIAKRGAARREVGLEVVEHEHERRLGERLGHQRQPRGVVVLAREPCAERPMGLDLAAAQREADRVDHRAQIPAPDVIGEDVAILGEPPHRATGDRALADAADADQRHGLRPDQIVAARRLAGPRGPEHPQRAAQLAAPADQLVLAELRHLAVERVDRRRRERLLGAAVLDQRTLEAGDQHGRGGVLGERERLVAAAGDRRLARALEVAPGPGQRVAHQDALAACQVLDEGAGQGSAVGVADRGLHRDHRRHAAAQQLFGEAGSGRARVGGAVAGVEEHRGRRAAGGLQRVGERDDRPRVAGFAPGRHRDRVALLVVELEHPRQAVAGQVQEVVLVAAQRRGDRRRIARLEDPDLRRAGLHRVEDVGQLALVIERVAPGLALVGRADRHQDLERTRQRPRQRPRQRTRPPQHAHRRLTHHQAIAQPQRLERQRDELGIAAVEHQLDGRARRAAGPVEQRRHLRAHRRREAQRRQLAAQGDDRRLALRALVGQRAATGDRRPEALAERRAQLEEPRRQRRVRARPDRGAVDRREDVDRIAGAHELDADRVDQPRADQRLLRRPHPAVRDRIEQPLEVVDRDPGQRLQELGDRRPRPQRHRDDQLAVLDHRVGERVDLEAHPRRHRRMLGEHDHGHVARCQARVDPRHDAVAGPEVLLVVPGPDAARLQRLHQRPHVHLVARAVADEDLAEVHGGSGQGDAHARMTPPRPQTIRPFFVAARGRLAASPDGQSTVGRACLICSEPSRRSFHSMSMAKVGSPGRR